MKYANLIVPLLITFTFISMTGCDSSRSNDDVGWTGNWEFITAERPSGENADLDLINLYGSVSEEEFTMVAVDSVFVGFRDSSDVEVPEYERQCEEVKGEILSIDQNTISTRLNNFEDDFDSPFFEVNILRDGEILEFQFTEAPDEAQVDGVKVIAQSVSQSPTEIADCSQ